MILTDFIRTMPKVELHVHLQGATQPETWLELARRNHVKLPADTVEGMREWFVFRNFRHFIDTYIQVSRCIMTSDDIELVARDFLKNQAAQNIVYSEVTFTPSVRTITGEMPPFEDQLAALNRAKAWAEAELGVSMNTIIDIPREVTIEQADHYAGWVIDHYRDGVVALGLGGYEPGNPPEKYARQFERALGAGIPLIPHAGETVGPESVWNAIKVCHPVRIEHGVRSMEDEALADYLCEHQIPLDVCPTSNILLGVYPRFEDHILPRMIEKGLYVTLNSDDPPMFNSTLTDEYLKSAQAFGWEGAMVEQIALNGVRATLLPDEEKTAMEQRFKTEFEGLKRQDSA